MKVTSDMIEKLGCVLKERQEAQVVSILAQKLELEPNKALNLFYSSDIAKAIEEGTYGVQYLSPEYLANEVIASMSH